MPARAHGHAIRRSPEYRIWTGMHSRCRNPRQTGFKYYGGKGVKVCERWRSFESFLADMGPYPGQGFSLDRRESSGNYEPGNCRWATGPEQSRHLQKISTPDLSKIFELYESGTTQVEIAQRFGVSQPQISKIINKKRRNYSCQSLSSRIRSPESPRKKL